MTPAGLCLVGMAALVDSIRCFRPGYPAGRAKRRPGGTERKRAPAR